MLKLQAQPQSAITSSHVKLLSLSQAATSDSTTPFLRNFRNPTAPTKPTACRDGHSAHHLPLALHEAGYELVIRAAARHLLSMSWTSADSSLLLPGCTLDLHRKIPHPHTTLDPLGEDTVICLGVVCSHYSTEGFAAIPFHANPKKKNCPSLPCVPW